MHRNTASDPHTNVDERATSRSAMIVFRRPVLHELHRAVLHQADARDATEVLVGLRAQLALGHAYLGGARVSALDVYLAPRTVVLVPSLAASSALRLLSTNQERSSE